MLAQFEHTVLSIIQDIHVMQGIQNFQLFGTIALKSSSSSFQIEGIYFLLNGNFLTTHRIQLFYSITPREIPFNYYLKESKVNINQGSFLNKFPHSCSFPGRIYYDSKRDSFGNTHYHIL